MSARVRTCLWVADRAEEAARFYVSLLPGSTLDDVVRPRPGVAVVDFTLQGAPYQFLEAAPARDKLTNVVSISVTTPDQAETDRLWAALTEGGEEIACGWLRDRFGLCWQIVPARFLEILRAPDKAAVGRAMTRMETMKKLDVAAFEAAFRGA